MSYHEFCHDCQLQPFSGILVVRCSKNHALKNSGSMPLDPLRYWCFYKAQSYYSPPSFSILCLYPTLQYFLNENLIMNFTKHALTAITHFKPCSSWSKHMLQLRKSCKSWSWCRYSLAFSTDNLNTLHVKIIYMSSLVNMEVKRQALLSKPWALPAAWFA